MNVHGELRRCARYSQGMTYPTAGGLYRMPHHPAHRRASRRVVLETVPRRDAAQRLSLAFTLLARGQVEQAVAPMAADVAGRSTGVPAGELPGEEATR
jgi:hypothetical protein